MIAIAKAFPTAKIQRKRETCKKNGGFNTDLTHPYEMLKEYNAKADSISDWRALAKLRNEFIQACIAL